MSIRQWMTSTTARTMLVTMMMASTTRVPPSSHPPAPSCAIRITKAEITFPQVWHSQRTTFHTLFFSRGRGDCTWSVDDTTQGVGDIGRFGQGCRE